MFHEKSISNRQILEILYRDWEGSSQEENRRVGSIKVASESNIPIAEIHRLQYLLVEKGEIVISNNDGQSMMSIQQNGISAYVDKRYLKEGAKDRWDGIYNWARILIPLLALILSVINYYTNQSLDSKIKDLETKIEKFKK